MQIIENFCVYYNFLKNEYVPEMVKQGLIKSPEMIFDLIENPDLATELLSDVGAADEELW